MKLERITTNWLKERKDIDEETLEYVEDVNSEITDLSTVIDRN